VTNQTSFQNLTIYVVNAVIDVPGDLTAAIDFYNLTAFGQALETAGLLSELNTTHGVTLFAPTDAAFTTAASQLQNATSNTTLLRIILENHIINGSSVYTSNLIADSGQTSAAGESLSATFNSSGSFIQNGNSTAKITSPDVILWNGVVHIIDTVLFNNETDQSAADSAASSAASSAATATAPETGPVGFTPSPTSSGGGGGSSSGAQQAIRLPITFGLGTVLSTLGLVAGLVLVL